MLNSNVDEVDVDQAESDAAITAVPPAPRLVCVETNPGPGDTDRYDFHRMDWDAYFYPGGGEEQHDDLAAMRACYDAATTGYGVAAPQHGGYPYGQGGPSGGGDQLLQHKSPVRQEQSLRMIGALSGRGAHQAPGYRAPLFPVTSTPIPRRAGSRFTFTHRPSSPAVPVLQNNPGVDHLPDPPLSGQHGRAPLTRADPSLR